MVSTELLRRYPFFAHLNHDQLRELAMISEEREFQDGDVLFKGGASADFLYLLQNGGIELHYVVTDERGMEKTQDFHVGTINPGEIFGVSAVIQPYVYTASGVASTKSPVIEIEGAKLRELCEEDIALKALFQERIASTVYKRLQDSRVLLLAT